MVKHFFAIAFSGAVFLNLPPVDVSRLEAWITIMWAYAVGLVIACWVEEKTECYQKWREAEKRRKRIMERRREYETGRKKEAG